MSDRAFLWLWGVIAVVGNVVGWTLVYQFVTHLVCHG